MVIMQSAGLRDDTQERKRGVLFEPTSTSCPACRSDAAAHNPAIPAPTTMTLRGISLKSVARIV